MWDDLERRLPPEKGGACIKAYAYGHHLHPVYRGMVVSDLNMEDSTLEQFFAVNEAAADEENALADDLDEAAVDIDCDDEENFLMGTFYKPSQTQALPQSQSLIHQTSLQAEVARYMSIDQRKAPLPLMSLDGGLPLRRSSF